MPARRKRIKNDTPWPEDWTVAFEWEGMTSREHEFTYDGGREWFIFNRHVTNNTTGHSWLDGFRQKPYDAFVSMHDDKPLKIRKRKVAGNAR